MKPIDIAAIKTSRSSSPNLWSDDWISTVFALYDYQIDQEKLSREVGDRIVADVKLQHVYDGGERANTVAVLNLDSQPFGILVEKGDGSELYVTDQTLFNRSFDLIQSCRKIEMPQYDVIDPNEENWGLVVFNGVAATEINGRTRLVEVEHLDAKGGLIFDDEAFDASVRELLKNDVPHEEMLRGFNSQLVQDAVAKAFIATVPGGLDVLEVGGYSDLHDEWTGVIVANSEGTFAIGVGAHGTSATYFNWTDHIKVRCLGGPEVIEEMRSAKTPQM